jgi:hypothetical protein
MLTINVAYAPNLQQQKFHECPAEECFYGGAKGGGKSCALVMEAFAYGLQYPGAVIYLFRETYDDLEANLIREWQEKVPRAAQRHPYNKSGHYATLVNGSVIKFRYIRNKEDADGYQGRSMDFVGIDELTKHTREAVQVLLSCLRSPKGYPPRFRATGNPGGVGHTYVKEDYIQATGYGAKTYRDKVSGNRRVFIPATVYDNTILMLNDPAYIRRLENLPENQRQAFLFGNWDIFEGQYFEEFDHNVHVIKAFEIPKNWNRYITLDYGLDMLACYFVAVDLQYNAYVYNEIYKPNLIISAAAKEIIKCGGDTIPLRYAPPDLWNRRQDTGKSAADIFTENKLPLLQASNKRVMGWYNVKEWLRVIETVDEQTGAPIRTSRLRIFKNCKNLIRTLPQLQIDEKDPNDVALEPHELTHGPDAIRYLFANRPVATDPDVAVEDDEDDEDGNCESYIA